MKNAVVLNQTGSVLRFGFQDFTTDVLFNPSTMSQLQVVDEATVPVVNGVPVELRYVKVVSAQFVEMTTAEKAVVDAATASSIVQRVIVNPEVVVATGGTDATTGFGTVIGGMKTSRPLKVGDYQLAVAFELALTAIPVWDNSGPRTAAQARLLWNGVEIQSWLNPLAQYSTFSTILGAALAEGETPTLDLQIRRFGQAGVSARARRIRIELAPTMAALSFA